MITIVSGKLGAGKSYHVCRETINHLRRGGVVATNMRVNLDSIRRIYHRRIFDWQLLRVSAEDDPRKIPVGDLRGHGRRRVMVVLDEALNWFASSESKTDPRKVLWGEWLRQSDKLGQDVFFIAQEFSRSAKWLRELAQVACDVRNFGQTRFLGLPIGKFLGLGRLYMAVYVDTRTKMLLGCQMGYLSPFVWECYDTAELYGFEAASSAYVSDSLPAYRLPIGPAWLAVPPLIYQFIRLFYAEIT